MRWGNAVRIQPDAREQMIDEATGRREEFLRISPCRTGWTYQPDVLFQRTASEYVSAWSGTRYPGSVAGVPARASGDDLAHALSGSRMLR